MNKFKLILFISLVISTLLIVFTDKKKDLHNSELKNITKILAFGDSLTYGKGAPNQSYPIALEALSHVSIVNAGLSGESSSKGLLRLEPLLQKHKPDLVILCHGGNDLIQQRSKAVLKQNILKMIQLSKKSGAKVLVVGVPNFKMIRFSTEALYEEAAIEESVMYEGDILSLIENDTSLKSDRIHPNAKGYTLMAEAFYEVLKENGLENK